MGGKKSSLNKKKKKKTDAELYPMLIIITKTYSCKKYVFFYLFIFILDFIFDLF